MHATYYGDVSGWKTDIRNHVTAFSESGIDSIYSVPLENHNALSLLQYLYLMSRYIVLEIDRGEVTKIPSDLPESLVEIIKRFWSDVPTWHWDHDDFRGLKTRLDWKFRQKSTAPEYHRAIFYSELFLFAIAADLQYYLHKKSDQRDFLRTILQYAEQAYKEYGQFQSDGGWLFQPGIWSEHPDFEYACHHEKRAGLEPCEIDNIARDSSHGSRHALWLRSLLNISRERRTGRKQVYQSILDSFSKQVLNEVIVPPNDDFPTHRLNNYMDGRNGLYRWGHDTQGKNDGYGPYELSGALTMGWLGFLNNRAIQDVYARLESQFPLPDFVVDVYVGPNTTRDRHPLVRNPDSYTNGMRKMIIRLAANISGPPTETTHPETA
jgi:hypothetical protein